jgi:hypothetical protein
MARQIPWAAAALLLGLLAGCSSGQQQFQPVRGKVLYHGTALAQGTIVFAPDASRGYRGPLSYAQIEADGSYTLHSDDHPGALVGCHRVTVSSVWPTAQLLPGQRFAVPLSLVPEKYRDPDRSGLACEVKGDGDNVINFDLD